MTSTACFVSRPFLRLVLPAILALAACSSAQPPAPAPSDSAPQPPALAKASTHPTTRVNLGRAVSLTAMEALLDEPGPIALESVTSANWTSPRSGLINLKHERAPDLEDGPEAVHIYFHAISHPAHGLYVVDTGVETALTKPNHALRSNELGKAYGFDQLDVVQPLGDWLGKKTLSGVFLTHLHLDHVLGLPDIPRSVVVYTGPGEADAEAEFNAYSQGTLDRLLAGRAPLAELDFGEEPVIDVFGDGSFFALNTPGHTPGSVAYVARTTEGSVLFTGDVCHTAWGWNNDVEPGTFTHDHAANAESLATLRKLAAQHPAMHVRLGHQSL